MVQGAARFEALQSLIAVSAAPVAWIATKPAETAIMVPRLGDQTREPCHMPAYLRTCPPAADVSLPPAVERLLLDVVEGGFVLYCWGSQEGSPHEPDA